MHVYMFSFFIECREYYEGKADNRDLIAKIPKPKSMIISQGLDK